MRGESLPAPRCYPVPTRGLPWGLLPEFPMHELDCLSYAIAPPRRDPCQAHLLRDKAAGGQRHLSDPFPGLTRAWETNRAIPLRSHMWTVTHSIVSANLSTRGILLYILLPKYFSLNKLDIGSRGLLLRNTIYLSNRYWLYLFQVYFSNAY